jgi:fluoride ion exporter CrcB/FEX
VQAVRLAEVQEMARAAGYVAASVGVGLLAAWAGMAAARALS